MSRQNLGYQGEEYASNYLIKKGYTILERNYRNKLGEIDLIAKQGVMLCFIEVKTRRNLAYGAPFEAVHASKQHKMVRLALCYLQQKFHTIEVPSRFDVMSIYEDPQGEILVEHIVNAFDLTYLSH